MPGLRQRSATPRTGLSSIERGRWCVAWVGRSRLVLIQQFPEHILQDTTMLVVGSLGRGVYAHPDIETVAVALCIRGFHPYRRRRRCAAVQTGNGECFLAVEAE